MYLIWSNQQGKWWRYNESGYTRYIEEAGRYSYEEAKKIVDEATLNGELKTVRRDPVTGNYNDSYDEVMVQEVRKD